jgi:hypothetical protein
MRNISVRWPPGMFQTIFHKLFNQRSYIFLHVRYTVLNTTRKLRSLYRAINSLRLHHNVYPKNRKRMGLEELFCIQYHGKSLNIHHTVVNSHPPEIILQYFANIAFSLTIMTPHFMFQNKPHQMFVICWRVNLPKQ